MVIVVTKTETKEEQRVRQKLDLDTKAGSVMDRGKYANSGANVIMEVGFSSFMA